MIDLQNFELEFQEWLDYSSPVMMKQTAIRLIISKKSKQKNKTKTKKTKNLQSFFVLFGRSTGIDHSCRHTTLKSTEFARCAFVRTIHWTTELFTTFILTVGPDSLVFDGVWILVLINHRTTKEAFTPFASDDLVVSTRRVIATNDT